MKPTIDKNLKFSKFRSEGGVRYDLHFEGKNVAYAQTKPTSERGTIFLDGLHVVPKFQGKGLAKMLMKKIESLNKGKTIRLVARPYKGKQLNATELISFYRKLGYRSTEGDSRMYKKIRKAVKRPKTKVL